MSVGVLSGRRGFDIPESQGRLAGFLLCETRKDRREEKGRKREEREGWKGREQKRMFYKFDQSVEFKWKPTTNFIIRARAAEAKLQR